MIQKGLTTIDFFKGSVKTETFHDTVIFYLGL